MKRLLIVYALLMLAAPFVHAQGSNVGCNPVLALCGGPLTVATLPAAPAKGTIASVSDGNSSSDCTVGGGTTLVTCRWSGSAWAQSGGGGGASTFDQLGSGTNTTAAMVVGTGASMSATGSGTIAATSLTALTGMPSQAADTVVMNATGGSAVPTAVAMPTCTAGAVLYNTSTHAWTCVAGGHIYWNPSVCVVQVAAPSLGGSLSPGTPPSATLTTAGDTTHPQTCGAGFSFTNRGTAQWIEWHKNIEIANPTGQLIVNFYTDAATSGNVIWDGLLACGASTTTNHPVYGSVQTLGTVVPGAINTLYSATLSNFNITCAAGSTVWLRLYLDSSTTSTGNILISDVQWTEQ